MWYFPFKVRLSLFFLFISNLIKVFFFPFLTSHYFFYYRFLSFFSESFRTEESDDIHAALALMYGYAAKYAPSTVIEARIDALVVWFFAFFSHCFSMEIWVQTSINAVDTCYFWLVYSPCRGLICFHGFFMCATLRQSRLL